MNIILGLLSGIGIFSIITSVKLHDKILEKANLKVENLVKENIKKSNDYLENREKIAKEQKIIMQKDNKILEDQLEKQKEIIKEKEELARKRESRVIQLSGTIKNLEKNNKVLNDEIGNRNKEIVNAAAKIAKTTEEQILNEMYKDFENEINLWKESKLNYINQEYKDEIDPIAKSIIKSCLQRYTYKSSVDTKEFSFKLKHDSAKGVLVGNGGKTINYFEEKAECVVIFNYEPNLVIISSLNMYNRAIAKDALMALSHKKHIDPKTIDHALEVSRKKLRSKCIQYGKKAEKMLGYKNLPEELLYLIGRLEYRTSYGQNIFLHSMEVAYFSRMLAESINANVSRALDAAFYHDLGKAIDHDLDSGVGHDHISKELMEKFKMDPLTIHAAFAHHDAVPCERAEDYLVKAADAMSASRPGARQQTMERYLKLVKELQERALNVSGVKKAYSVNAGREVRVIVDEKNVDDSQAILIAEKIAKDIEANMGYPGTIKINVLRKIKAEDLAKEKS